MEKRRLAPPPTRPPGQLTRRRIAESKTQSDTTNRLLKDRTPLVGEKLWHSQRRCNHEFRHPGGSKETKRLTGRSRMQYVAPSLVVAVVQW